MKLVGNISVMTLSHLIVNSLAFISVPFLIEKYGLISYSVIAFYIAFQAWLITFDFGLTPAIIRKLSPILSRADYATKLTAQEITSVYRWLFILIALLIASISFIGFSAAEVFDRFDQKNAIYLSSLIAIIAALRFYSTLERAIHRAGENFIFLSIANTTFATLRYLAVFLVLAKSNQLIHYFQYQVFVSLIEALTFSLANNKAPFSRSVLQRPNFSIILQHSSFLAFSGIAGICWLSIVSSDKFFLFGNITDEIYSTYSVTVQFASVVFLVIAPIIGVLQPRVAALYANNGIRSLASFLYKYNRVSVPIIGGLAMLLGLWFPTLFLLWTGVSADTRIITIFYFFLLGYLCSAYGLIGYLFQFAKADMKVHGVTHILALVFYVPAVFIIAKGGDLTLISMLWFLMNFFIAQVAGVYVLAKFISIKYAANIIGKSVLAVGWFVLGFYIYSNYLNQFDTYVGVNSSFSDILLVDVLGSGSFTLLIAGTAYWLLVSDGVVDDIFVEGREKSESFDGNG